MPLINPHAQQAEIGKLLTDLFKSLHPEESDVDVEARAQKSIEATNVFLLPGLERNPAKTSGLITGLRKSKERYSSVSKREEKTQPAILVDVYKNDVFAERKVCTAPMVLASPESYDDRAYILLIGALVTDQSWWYRSDESMKKLNLVEDLACALKKRWKEELARQKKLQAEYKEKQADVPSGWKLREQYFLGKSLVILAEDLPEIVEPVAPVQPTDEEKTASLVKSLQDMKEDDRKKILEQFTPKEEAKDPPAQT